MHGVVQRGGSGWETGLDVGQREAVDAEEFLPRGIAAEDGDGAAREAERLGEEFAEHFVGAALHGWRVDFDFEGVAEPADDLAARGVGDRFDGERAGSGGHDGGWPRDGAVGAGGAKME